MHEPGIDVWFIVVGTATVAAGGWMASTARGRGPRRVEPTVAVPFGAAYLVMGVTLAAWGARVIPFALFMVGLTLFLILLAIALVARSREIYLRGNASPHG